jgi:hypothetical protein
MEIGERKLESKTEIEKKSMKKSLSLGRGCRDSHQAGAAGEGFHLEFLLSPCPSGRLLLGLSK